MKIHIVGNPESPTGYGNHAKGIIDELLKRPEVELSLEPYEAKQPQYQRIEKRDNRQETIITITDPLTAQFLKVQRPKLLLPYCVFEGDRIPQHWANILQDEQVLVPSEVTKKSCVATGLNPKNVHVVPHGYDPQIFYPKKLEEINDDFKKFKKEYKTVFLFNKGLRLAERDRSGLYYACKAFTQAFTKADSVCFVVHINPSYGTPDIPNLLKSWGCVGPDLPPIFSFADLLNQDQLNDLYNACDCFVMPSLAESFGMPALEANACGKPVMHNYLGIGYQAKGYWINCYEIEATDPDPMYRGIKWWKPDIDAWASTMRTFHEEGCKTIVPKNLTWKHSVDKIIEVIKKCQKPKKTTPSKKSKKPSKKAEKRRYKKKSSTSRKTLKPSKKRSKET